MIKIVKTFFADQRNIAIAVLLVIIAVAAWYGSSAISDQQRTIDAARADLRSANLEIEQLKTLNASIQHRLDRSIGLIESIAARNTELENRIATIQERNNTNAGTIDECIELAERLREQTKSIRATGQSGETKPAD